MHNPSHFEETRVEILHQLMQDNPLATLVTVCAGGLNADHIPFELATKLGPFGTLHGHVARANPVWHDFDDDTEMLAIFQGPAAYITPSWYPSKQQHGKVVPTYNYAVVHAYGRMRAIEDRAWLRAQIERLTRQHEIARPIPWSVSDAPAEYLEKALDAIVGIEISITRLIGKWKMSQNKNAVDRDGVVAGLRENEPASAVADLIKRTKAY